MHWTAVSSRSGVGKEGYMFIYIFLKKFFYISLIFSIFHSKSYKSDCNRAVHFPPICTISFEGQLSNDKLLMGWSGRWLFFVLFHFFVLGLVLLLFWFGVFFLLFFKRRVLLYNFLHTCTVSLHTFEVSVKSLFSGSCMQLINWCGGACVDLASEILFAMQVSWTVRSVLWWEED